ncbi:MAG TPA: VWA domain-containing protein [Thermoanaerobaculia bacterium]|nr:VWA domain-containing protein [Thermoanaerobaculia bacterium]
MAADPRQEPTFFEAIDVDVAEIEVFVADREGRPVSGLTAADFELYEDGHPVAISNFYAAADAASTAPAGAAALPDGGGPAAEVAASKAEEEQRLYLAVLVDNSSLAAMARNRALAALRGFVGSRLGPRDRLLLAAYDGTLRVRQAPTGDAAALAAALSELAAGSTRGFEGEMERRRILDELSGGSLPTAGEHPDTSAAEAEAIFAGIRLYAEARHAETRRTVAALDELLSSLAGLPGHKALLYVGGGIALRPGEALFQAWRDRYPWMAARVGAGLDAFQTDATRLVDQLIERADAGRVTVYALGITAGVSTVPSEAAGGRTWTRELAALESLQLGEPLRRLAGATGGLAAIDAPSEGPLLAGLRGDLDSYFSLGYAPLHGRDGARHRVEVKTRDRTLTVRTREAYRDRAGGELAADRVRSALLFGGVANALGVAIDFEQERPGPEGQVEVSALVKFPLAKLVLLPQETVHEGRVRLFVGARDERGRTSPIVEVAVPIRIPNENLLAALGQTVGTRVTLRLRPGEQRVAVALRDELGKTDSTVTAAYTAGRTDGAAPHGPSF